MKNLKNINSFVFNYAQYEITDISGNRGLLKIDYKNKTHSYEGIADQDLTLELNKIARDLLSRKHGVNFANR
jgi:hypothetical protein